MRCASPAMYRPPGGRVRRTPAICLPGNPAVRRCVDSRVGQPPSPSLQATLPPQSLTVNAAIPHVLTRACQAAPGPWLLASHSLALSLPANTAVPRRYDSRSHPDSVPHAANNTCTAISSCQCRDPACVDSRVGQSPGPSCSHRTRPRPLPAKAAVPRRFDYRVGQPPSPSLQATHPPQSPPVNAAIPHRVARTALRITTLHAPHAVL